MIRKLASCIREYKRATIFTLIFIVGEVFLEVLIPFITADLVNAIKAGIPMSQVVKTGLLLILMALLLSLIHI